VFENSESGFINKNEVQSAIEEVAKDKHVTLNTIQSKALVEKVFAAADYANTGKITRQQLRKAIEQHSVEASIVLKEEYIPDSTEEASVRIMKVLEANTSGTINKVELK